MIHLLANINKYLSFVTRKITFCLLEIAFISLSSIDWKQILNKIKIYFITFMKFTMLVLCLRFAIWRKEHNYNGTPPCVFLFTNSFCNLLSVWRLNTVSEYGVIITYVVLSTLCTSHITEWTWISDSSW